MKLSEIVNKSNKWIFCNVKISRFLFLNLNQEVSKKYFLINFKIIIIFIYSFFLILMFYFLQYFYLTKKNNYHNKYLILKVNEGHDEKNIIDILNINENEIIKINAYKKTDYMKIKKISFITFLKKFKINLTELFKIINYNYPNTLKELIFKKISINLAHITYLRAFFNEYKNSNKEIIVLTSGALFSANAAISENICAYYFMHGLAGKAISSITLPQFDYIYVYSSEEKSYLKNLKIKSKIMIYPYNKVFKHQNSVVIFLPSNNELWKKKENLDDLVNLLKVLKKYNLNIHFKNHPKHNSKIINELSYLFKIKIIKGDLGNATSIINKIKPFFVISWFSTAICESLNSNIIPITFAGKYSYSNETNDLNMPPPIIYPILERSLSWPSESHMIYDLLDNKLEYKNVLKELKIRNRNENKNIFIVN